MAATDAQLVARVRPGDASAFDTLVRRHLRAAHAVALARLGDPADAEDVCQDAFIVSLDRIDECRNPHRFAAWLLEIVRNRAHNYRAYRMVRAASALGDLAVPSGDADHGTCPSADAGVAAGSSLYSCSEPPATGRWPS